MAQVADGAKATEKEVMFVDVCSAPPSKVVPPNLTTKALKSIMKNSPSSVEGAPPKWEAQSLQQESSTFDGGAKRTIVETIDAITQESDIESEADFFRKLTPPKDASLESDFAEESILSHDEDDDFKVHFVHHGKKAEEKMNAQTDLMFQINELQEAVISMKGSLKDAVTKLSLVDGSCPTAELELLRNKCEGNSAEILKMVLALNTDLSSLRLELGVVYKRQETIQKCLSHMLEDQKLMASELLQAGVISQQTKSRLENPMSLVGNGAQSGSGSHSNDSGVALLLEKSPNAFGDDSGPLHLSGQRISDQDSLPEQPALLVPASVYDYVAGLTQPACSFSSNATSSNQLFCQDGLPTPLNEETQPTRCKEGEEERSESFDYGVVYDSDSSLTVAANKTISLSTCISQEMRVHDAANSSPVSSRHPEIGSCSKHEAHAECEISVTTKESGCSQNRRRRPLLGVSSAKMYLSTSHSHPTSGEKEHRLRHRYISKGCDPREVQRYKLAKELVDTEKQYCRTLWTIQDVFAEPLKKTAILSNKDLKTLFPEEVYLLYEKHCLLQHQLKERLASWKWQPLVGDILARFTDPQQCEVLRLYTSYVNDFPQVLKTFHKLCHTSQPFTEFIKRCLDQPSCKGLDLGAFLLTPVQRVPKYILLLKQLLKYTSSTHPDYRLIDIVLERLREFLSRLNCAMEQSFKIVSSTLSPTINALPSSAMKYRCGRNGRKSGNGSRETGALSSPNSRRNRHARIYQPSLSPSRDYRSPKRSSSIAGGTESPRKISSKQFPADRSSSLPRGFTSMSSDSPDSSGDGQESSPERMGKIRGEKPRYRSPHESTPYHQRSKYLSLTPARSVTNVLVGDELKTTWEELASSEPSLIEKAKIVNTKSLSKNVPSLSVAPTATATHKLVTWTDSPEALEDRSKKKGSIKSSLKSMFNFKKRPNGQRGSREEPLYTSSSIILETSRECSPAHSLYAQTSKISASNLPPSVITSVPVGDFLDEDGNPCSNV